MLQRERYCLANPFYFKQKGGVAENTIIRYRKILVKYGFIKNIFKKKSTSRNNIYQLALGQDLTDPKILSYMVTNCNDTSKMSSSMVTKCNPNNNNLNNNNITTTKRENAVVAAVNFKKLKTKGEEKM